MFHAAASRAITVCNPGRAAAGRSSGDGGAPPGAPPTLFQAAAALLFSFNAHRRPARYADLSDAANPFNIGEMGRPAFASSYPLFRHANSSALDASRTIRAIRISPLCSARALKLGDVRCS